MAKKIAANRLEGRVMVIMSQEKVDGTCILHSLNRGGFRRLPMPKNNRLIRPRVTR